MKKTRIRWVNHYNQEGKWVGGRFVTDEIEVPDKVREDRGGRGKLPFRKNKRDETVNREGHVIPHKEK